MKIEEILNETDATLDKRVLASQKLVKSADLRNQAAELIKNQDKDFALKALMVFEVIGRERFDTLEAFIPSLINHGKLYKDSSSRRCLSKIYNLAICSDKNPETHFNLSRQSKLAIIEQSFLWMVSQEATAVKVFSMQNIFDLKEEESWISEQLQGILEKDIAQSSAGYKSRGIKILRKLKQ